MTAAGEPSTPRVGHHRPVVAPMLDGAAEYPAVELCETDGIPRIEDDRTKLSNHGCPNCRIPADTNDQAVESIDATVSGEAE